MAFTRIRTINGKQYRYLEKRWREGGKVRSRSVSLGPVSGDASMGFIRRQFGPTYGIDWDAIEAQEKARAGRESNRYAEHLSKLHEEYGLTLGPAVAVPVEKDVVNLGQEKASPGGEADLSETQGL